MVNEHIYRNIDSIRNYTGLKDKEVETRIRDLDIEKQACLVIALKNNNPNNLVGDILQAYNSLRACQDFNILIPKSKGDIPIVG